MDGGITGGVEAFNKKGKKKRKTEVLRFFYLERETRFELATPTLARLCSTTELFPQKLIHKQRVKMASRRGVEPLLPP